MGIKDTKKEADKIKQDLSSLQDSLEDMVDELKPLLNLNSMEKDLAKIKSFANKSIKDKRQNEGETCMHGNSWHSNCSECDELHTIDDIFLLVEEFPNDAELGAKVRELYNHYISDSDNTKE